MKFICVLLMFSTVGCVGMRSPSPLRAMRTADELQAMGSLSDAGIVMFATEALDDFEGSAVSNTIVALSGGGTIGSLGTAAVAVPAQAKGLMLGANAVLMALNFWRPIDRLNADNMGSGLIRDALGTYVQALIADNFCTIPNNRVTPAGATLFATANAAIKVVNDLRAQILDLGSQAIRTLLAAQTPTENTARARRAGETAPCN